MNEPSGQILVTPLMDSREVAAYLKVSESTLSRWRAEEKGPPFMQLGGVARYRHEAIEAWLASLEQMHERT
ncbi:helix-turn-helix domain-containing protein [Kocuria carniphila]|uniref:Helix-turn-helix domain-containing protein n=1 Tax=Kocuria carniphila TaxID=262208 RepID=A0ABV3V581_9MICC